MKSANRARGKSDASRHAAAETVDRFRAQHLDLDIRQIAMDDGPVSVLINDSESPLAWLARRKGRDGRTMISPHQFLAGEKLRADFTRGQMSPRVTSRWSASSGRSIGAGNSVGEMTDQALAARQRVASAMNVCGPEFAGLLMDVCCFLRGLEDVERERGWPPRSAKIVLQLALDRLARHYGFLGEASGAATSRIRAWAADDAIPEGR